eukprot:CAMPEP_0174760628 /NCGR_PEP_ID=MMETSP1094-20130205/108858_1 /TAXON_ID=156173 /ORGANISM="Chrysochromulina brevifilum, Strain UTEX LB 985" /LENGTH=507 /DNA_ID=CAMNT_0015966569 /DNA_START=90 /DNA_END=1615 /DNA_ORIENTATION=-
MRCSRRVPCPSGSPQSLLCEDSDLPAQLAAVACACACAACATLVGPHKETTAAAAYCVPMPRVRGVQALAARVSALAPAHHLLAPRLSPCLSHCSAASSLLVSRTALLVHSAAYATAMKGKAGKQDFLEAEPYWDQSNVPSEIQVPHLGRDAYTLPPSSAYLQSAPLQASRLAHSRVAAPLMADFDAAYATAMKGKAGKQDFLEAEPYWDQSNVPVNTYKNKSPFTAKVISTKRIVGPKATGETCHIIMDHEGKMPYWEGQSYGVIPPGTNPKNGKPNTVRLYSIASSRYGDDMTGTTTSLCVRRATYWCPELKADDPAKKGVCSNFLCDSKPGQELKLTGPSGKVMLIPEKNPNADLIMVATGTGIAPYRSFIRRLFVEDSPYGGDYKGLAWLFLGVANTDALLYDDEWQPILKSHPNNFRLDYALSREQTNVDGGKMYIQDKVKEYADEVFTRMDNGAHMYFCGLKGMMPGITEMLESVSKSKGMVWEEKLKEWKKAGQWHVEVY